MLGGMRAVTWTQVAQYIVLIIAYLIPVFWISNNLGLGVFPHISYGSAVSRITELEALHGLGVAATEILPGLANLKVAHADIPAGGMAAWKFISLAICMMLGTASLPHILMRYFTTPSVKSARKSVAWSLLFIFILYFSAPCLATLSKLAMLDPDLATGIIGKPFADVAALDWIKNWSSVGFLAISDSNGNGILELNEFFLRADVVVLATPEIAGLPYVISGLVAAGGMAAAMSTADGLLLAIANALSHDMYYKIIDPLADTKKRLIVARVLLIVIGGLGAYIASMKLTSILGAVAWAFDFAMSGLFVPLVLGIWWKRANRAGALAGMFFGLLSGTAYLIYVAPAFMGNDPWLGIDHLRFGIIGTSVSFIAMIVVSLMTEAPDAATQKMVDETRVPSGDPIIAQKQ
jgi:cation/acetate symporter